MMAPSKQTHLTPRMHRVSLLLTTSRSSRNPSLGSISQIWVMLLRSYHASNSNRICRPTTLKSSAVRQAITPLISVQGRLDQKWICLNPMAVPRADQRIAYPLRIRAILKTKWISTHQDNHLPLVSPTPSRMLLRVLSDSPTQLWIRGHKHRFEIQQVSLLLLINQAPKVMRMGRHT